MYDHYFSNFGHPPVPEDIRKDSAIRHARFLEKKIFKGFSHTNAQGSKLDLALKGQTSTYDNSFSNVGRPPVPDDSCKGSAPRHSRF